jgi:two-component system CheB/CheR fusion protein
MRKGSPSRQEASAEPEASVTRSAPLTIVGIGASAGGLEAFEAFFRACPADSGMAFVLVPHLSPDHQSHLTEILQRSTAMPVLEALDQIAVAADHIYVIPPNRELTIRNGVLQLCVPALARGHRMPIDAFLRSLADDRAERAIGVILSGTATDGTLGLQAILGTGGWCIVQEPSSARYGGMPQSAIAAGHATHILPAEEMPALLRALTQRPGCHLSVPAIVPEKTLSGINQILLQVRSATGHDFSLYKKSTIGRRIERRMAQHNIEELAVYARYLKENPAEAKILFEELLINVTRFFRDPAAFVALKQAILPALQADRRFRVWVAGCASGEEAYSIAIVLQELLEELRETQAPDITLQIYATDLDADAIAVARAGHYPPNIAQDITPERLHRFFNKDDGGFKVKKELREMVVFAVQNVIKDPPFTRLDLLSCRNLMIYLEPELQNRLILNFHYALKPDGILLLSTSESITTRPDLFSALDRRWKLYRAQHGVAATSRRVAGDLAWASDKKYSPKEAPMSRKAKFDSVAELSNRALLQTYAPASVSTDAHGNILYVHGDIGRYLRPAPGPLSTNIIDMAREGLQLELRTALFNAATQATPTLNQEVSINIDGSISKISFSLRRLPSDTDNLLLLSFQDVVEPGKPAANRRGKKSAVTLNETGYSKLLERELAHARNSLQAIIKEQQATNEELQSTNEELQSANEELETSTEELQSLNEEMITVNAEQTTRIEQLSDLQNDMKNLLDSISIGTLFLDDQLRIRSYTREAVKAYRLVKTDIHRPLADIKSNLEESDLLTELQTVLDTLIPCEREVQITTGAWYLARMQPYRTLDNIVEGVVLTFTEITDLKRASEAVLRSAAQLATALEVAHLGSWELEIPEGQAIALATSRSHWTGEMFTIFGTPPVERTMSLQDVLDTLSAEDRERVVSTIQNSLNTRQPYDIEYQVTRPDGTIRDVHARGKAIADASGRISRLIGTTLDVTESRKARCIRCHSEHAQQLAENIVNTVSEPLIVLDGNLRVVSASASFYSHFHVTTEESVGCKIYDLGNGQWDIPALRRLIEDILPHGQPIEDYIVEHDFPGLGPRHMVINARRMVTALGNTELILLAIVVIAAVAEP